MKVGDVLIYINKGDYGSQSFTVNKHYIIHRIDNFIPEYLCGWIRDDNNNELYFKEEDAIDENWKYLKDIRKNKLKKINLCSIKE